MQSPVYTSKHCSVPLYSSHFLKPGILRGLFLNLSAFVALDRKKALILEMPFSPEAEFQRFPGGIPKTKQIVNRIDVHFSFHFSFVIDIFTQGWLRYSVEQCVALTKGYHSRLINSLICSWPCMLFKGRLALTRD